jgi:dipeptidyl aminopeptidase/acylaminoacyl peptidase
LAFSSPVNGDNQIWVINANGTKPAKPAQQVTDDPIAAIDPTWSPDGSKIAFASYQHNTPDIEVLDLPNGKVTRLTTDPGVDQQPQWSPAGNLIAFASNRSGSFEIYTMTPDGGNQQPVTTQFGANTDPAWSPTGARLAYTNALNQVRHLYAIGLSDGAPLQLTNGDGNDDTFPAWSPDGTKIAFTRNRGLWMVSADGESASSPATDLSAPGVDPAWAPLPPQTAAPVSGMVTATTPGSATPAPVNSSAPLPVGTVVDATSGSVLVAFTPLTSAPAAQPSTALVSGATFTIALRTPTLLSLDLKAPACGRASAAAGRGRRPGRVRVNRGHMRIRTNQVTISSRQAGYVVTNSCLGTRLSVIEGLVLVTFRQGKHRTVRVPAGQSFFARERLRRCGKHHRMRC